MDDSPNFVNHSVPGKVQTKRPSGLLTIENEGIHPKWIPMDPLNLHLTYINTWKE